MWCMSRCVVVMKLSITCHPQLRPPESSSFRGRMFKLYTKIWCRFVALLNQSFWMWWPEYTWSLNGIYPIHYYSKVVIVHTSAFQTTRLGWQVHTVLIILKMARLFLGRPRRYTHICMSIYTQKEVLVLVSVTFLQIWSYFQNKSFKSYVGRKHFLNWTSRLGEEDGGEIGGSRVHFPSTPVKHLADLRSRANIQWYFSIYEDRRPKIEDTERSDGETIKPGVLKRPEIDCVTPINISSRPLSTGD